MTRDGHCDADVALVLAVVLCVLIGGVNWNVSLVAGGSGGALDWLLLKSFLFYLSQVRRLSF